jgi:flagellar biosynthesis protein FlhG
MSNFAPVIAPAKKIWAIGGGKGGVGKSFVISNLAISLSRLGKQVTVVDLDLGSANLHTCLGSDIPVQTLSDFLAGRVTNLQQIVNQCVIPNVSFISGANDSVSAANVPEEQHRRLLANLMNISCDYLLLDLGAGTHTTTLDSFLLANRPIVTITPEPTSIENGYRFVKSAYFRWIRLIESKLGLKAVVDQAMDHKNHLGIRTPSDLINRIAQLNPAMGEKFKEEVQKFEVFLIMNQVRTQNDVEVGNSVRTVCKKYFGIETHYVGYLDYDNAVWQSVRKRRPLILEYPYSNLVGQFAQIAKNLDDYERYPRSNLLRTAGG